MTRHRDYDLTDAPVIRNGDPFDMPSQPQPGESDELDLVYRDLTDLTAAHERLRKAARDMLSALGTDRLGAALAALREAL